VWLDGMLMIDEGKVVEKTSGFWFSVYSLHDAQYSRCHLCTGHYPWPY
jgi:hypothetical protein